MTPAGSTHERAARLGAILTLCCLLAACSPLAGQSATDVPVPPAALPASVTPEPTRVIATPAGSLDPTPAPAEASLVSLREDRVFVSDGWGANSRPVLSLGGVTALVVRGSQIAYVSGGKILVADLRTGAAPRQVSDAPPAFLLGPDLFWTADGDVLLTIADHAASPSPRSTTMPEG